MAEEKDVVENNEEELPPKKSFLKFIILGAVVIVLGFGGYIGWDLYGKRDKGENKEDATNAKSASKAVKEEIKINCPLESFIVNLMDRSGSGKRYLKVNIILEVGNQEDGKMVNKYKPQLRDTILLLLSSQSFEEINTIDGKLGLKQELLLRVNQVFGKPIVQRVYFTEFVVQ